MKRVLQTAIVLALLAGAAIAAVNYAVERFMSAPMSLPEAGLTMNIVPGSSFAGVSRQLVESGAIDDDRWFRLYARWHDLAGAIHAGEYVLEAGSTPLSALEQFTNGEVRLHAFTIIEGWNRWELLDAIRGNAFLEHTLTEDDWPALLASLGATTTNPEGLFLPETYRFPRGTSDRELLGQAYGLMQDALDEEWQSRSPEAPVNSPYETLILASIIEKETARGDERAKIAGVFARRLDKRMRLQTDPTVIYGIGPTFNGNLTRRDLQTATPYNTYTRHGLPPTPIAMPGRAAIQAALHPEEGDTLYFVATGLGDGSHKFSETKAEHDQAVAEYLRRLRRRDKQGT